VTELKIVPRVRTSSSAPPPAKKRSSPVAIVRLRVLVENICVMARETVTMVKVRAYFIAATHSSEFNTLPYGCVISDEKDCPTRKECGANPKKCEQICVTTVDGKEGCACRLGFVLLPNEIG